MRASKVVGFLTLISLFPAAIFGADALSIRIEAGDQTAIQQAIDQLPASGGEVILAKLTNPVSVHAAIVIDRDNVTLTGDGAVVLRLADAANTPAIVLGQTRAIPTATRTNIHLRNLIIDG